MFGEGRNVYEEIQQLTPSGPILAIVEDSYSKQGVIDPRDWARGLNGVNDEGDLNINSNSSNRGCSNKLEAFEKWQREQSEKYNLVT